MRSLMGIKVEGICAMLEVFDMPTLIAFYRDVLDFVVVKASQPGDDFDWGLLRHGDMELMLNTLHEKHNRPTAPDHARVAAHGDTWLFLGCRDLDAAYAHLRAHGIAPGSGRILRHD